MYLAIDNSSSEIISLYYCLSERFERRDFLMSSEITLLGFVQQLLNELALTSRDLKGLLVVVGKGRFTATRVATTVGNTLAYACQIPIMAIDDVDKLDEDLLALKQKNVGEYISARYSGEARIGIK